MYPASFLLSCSWYAEWYWSTFFIVYSPRKHDNMLSLSNDNREYSDTCMWLFYIICCGENECVSVCVSTETMPTSRVTSSTNHFQYKNEKHSVQHLVLEVWASSLSERTHSGNNEILTCQETHTHQHSLLRTSTDLAGLSTIYSSVQNITNEAMTYSVTVTWKPSTLTCTLEQHTEQHTRGWNFKITQLLPKKRSTVCSLHLGLNWPHWIWENGLKNGIPLFHAGAFKDRAHLHVELHLNYSLPLSWWSCLGDHVFHVCWKKSWDIHANEDNWMEAGFKIHLFFLCRPTFHCSLSNCNFTNSV